MTAKHTAGPWFADSLGIVYSQVTQKPVMTGEKSNIEAYANAKLISCAPDLVNFARAVQAHARDKTRQGDPTWQELGKEASRIILEVEGY